MNNIPVVGWILDLIFKTSLAVPFWLFWTVFDIGADFFAFLPAQYQAIGFLDTVGVFVCLGILKGFSPFAVTSSSSGGDATVGR